MQSSDSEVKHLEPAEKKKHTSVYILPSDLERLGRVKIRTGRKVADIIRTFIRRGLDEEGV